MVLTTTPKVSIGWPAHEFTAPDYNNVMHSLKDCAGPKGTMIAFICNHCPYVKRIIGQLVEDARYLATKQISTIAIMSNDWHTYPDDAPDKMKQFAEDYQLSFPYLVDESQEIARSYDAVCTPDFFGFDSTLTLQYRGRIVDPQHQSNIVEHSDLREAMGKIAETGKGPEIQHNSLGCSIKWRNMD